MGKKEYNYEYEDGRIVRATESNITVTNEIVTSKVIVNTIKYYYDTEGKMTKKVITPAVGSAHTVYHETNNDNTVVKFSADGRTVTSHSKTDSFGRKEFDELQLGTDFISRQFVYHAGKVTDTHKDNAKVKSSATTQLVSQIILSDGRTLSYEYDAEERITKVTDSVDGTTTYTYDALGQLLTETKNGIIVNTMVYDNYGNIVKKNGKVYTYGNTVWKDLLTGFDGKTISYDAQGNPTSYLGKTLTWEKGRQLKSFGGNTYTYNANGIRTSKTVGGVKHTYTLEGTKILRETWGANTLIPIYDNEESVCGILYNDVPYYFVKNLQGDVIAIVDKDAQTVAEYSYDAWGVPEIKLDSSECQIATINPFRYRGYYYDGETELYYLLSRYYNPSLGRFINSDAIDWLGTNEQIIETNIFAYCKNDCVNLSDEIGFGGIDSLLGVLGSSIDILAKIIDMIGNSCNKERKALENSVALLTKRQSRNLASIKSLQEETGKLSKRLGWIGYGITFVSLVVGFAASYSTGHDLDASLIELGIESFISLIEFGAGKLFDWIARFIPYVGFLIGFIAGWLISHLLDKFFNSRRVERIISKFKSYIQNVKISVGNWLKYAVKSLNA